MLFTKGCYSKIEGTMKIIQHADVLFHIKLLRNLMLKWMTLRGAEEDYKQKFGFNQCWPK